MKFDQYAIVFFFFLVRSYAYIDCIFYEFIKKFNLFPSLVWMINFSLYPLLMCFCSFDVWNAVKLSFLNQTCNQEWMSVKKILPCTRMCCIYIQRCVFSLDRTYPGKCEWQTCTNLGMNPIRNFKFCFHLIVILFFISYFIYFRFSSK